MGAAASAPATFPHAGGRIPYSDLAARAEYMRAYRDKNRETLRANGRRYYHRHKERSRIASRAGELRRRYQITPAEYDERLAAQGGGCAICGAASDGRALPVDHVDTADGPHIRGILCFKCNRGLGAFGDTAAGVKRALDYLEANAPV